MHDSQKVLDSLKAINRDDCDENYLSVVDTLIAEVGEIEAVRAVAGTFVITEMIARLSAEMADIDKRLLTSRSKALPDAERDGLLDKKELYKNFIGLFDADARLARIAQQVENL